MAIDFVTQKLTYFEEEVILKRPGKPETKKISLLEEYLKNPNIDLADIVGMAGDMLLGGVDTV